MPTPTPAAPAAAPARAGRTARQAKPWWLSRTLIANTVLLAVATAESQLHVLQPVLPVDLYTLLAFALPVLNVALRAITSAPLGTGRVSQPGA